MKIEIDSLQAIDTAAQTFLQNIHSKKIICFYASMGSGKTTFIKSLCKTLGVPDEVTSPTFAIINEYNGAEGKIFHFDLYRLETIADAYNIGIEEYFTQNSFCFIEWPELIEPLLPDNALKVTITVTEDGKRVVEF